MVEQYQLIDPEAPVGPINAGSRWSIESVRYDTHPAYAELFDKENNLVRKQALKVFIKSFIGVLIKRLIKYECIPLEYRKPSNLSQRLGFFAKALKNALWPNFYGKNKLLSTDFAKQTYDCINDTGICVVKLTEEQTENIATAAQSSFDYLLARRAETARNGRVFEDSRSYKKRSEHGELFHTIENILTESGALEVAAKYMGREVSLVDVNPQLNDDSDDFWKKLFPDMDIEHPPAAYFHRDASGGDLKVIFYLSDVGLENGPFNFVLGSHSMRLSRLDDYICEANDSNGFAGTSLAARLQFAALPRSLRQKGTFGNDLRKVDELQQQLLDATW